MPTEDDVWRDLRKVLPKGHWVRIENGICDPGTPDVNFCIDRGAGHDALEGWLELKYTWSLPLEHPVLPTQKIWIRKRIARHGHVLIAVAIQRELFITGGHHAPFINNWFYPDFEHFAIARAANYRDPTQVQAAFAKAFDWLQN